MTIAPSRPSSDSGSAPLGRVLSHGRGGAGNIGYDAEGYRESEEALRVPTLKTPVYTTGRGGSGNMAYNTDPQTARAAQDVETVPARLSMSEFHGGRGGAGNVMHLEDEAAALAQEQEERKRLVLEREKKRAADEHKGWADRGKEKLMEKFGRKKTASPAA